MRTIGLILPAEPEATFACPVCGKSYKSEAALEKHRKDKHPEGEESTPADPEE